MHILVFGAGGRSGGRIAQRLLDAGHTVTAAVRPGNRAQPPGNRAEIDLADAEGVRAHAARADAVVSALASGRGNPAASTLARALLPLDGLRFVTIGGAGVDAPGDAKGLADRAIGAIMRLTVGEMLADRQAEHDLLVPSRLRWTMLRPPRLTEKPGRGQWRLTHDAPATAQIARDDLAAATVAVLADPSTEGRAPFVSA
jgi:putative NADH-flavin reductase